MRKTPEAFDDEPGTFGVRRIGSADPTRKRDRPLLIGQAFRMLEREIEEHLQLGIDSAIMPGPDRRVRFLARHRIAGEHSRRAAKSVSRKLVQQEQEGQRSIGPASPIGRGRRAQPLHGAARKRSRKRLSKSASLANQRRGPASVQKSTTDAASARPQAAAIMRRRPASRAARLQVPRVRERR